MAKVAAQEALFNWIIKLVICYLGFCLQLLNHIFINASMQLLFPMGMNDLWVITTNIGF